MGSGGSGIVTLGELLLRIAARAGYYALMSRSAGPQIRGGESAAYLTIGCDPVEAASDRFDVLAAVDWQSADRFLDEIPLDAESLIIDGEAQDTVSMGFHAAGASVISIDLKALGKAVPRGRANMAALGYVAEVLGLPSEAVDAIVDERFEAKGEKVLEPSRGAVGKGREAAIGFDDRLRLRPAQGGDGRWIITGNQAAGLGALRGGIRFVAAYPITPATELLEWISPRIGKLGGSLVQAEDELASINMAIGAAYAGRPALTATSGPGLALMLESLGLAVAAEVPIVVVDVMRGGPSTGIPTKSEQGDLNVAVHGLPGDAPHLVLAPRSIGDCLFTTQWAVHLAESLQAPAIVLSDQSLGQSLAVIDQPANLAFATRPKVAEPGARSYRRYKATASGVSPMALPGTGGLQYTADGLAHDERGIPSSGATHHVAQLEKRERKINSFDYGRHWAEIRGEGPRALITWGSVSGAVNEAMRRLDPDGRTLRSIAIRLLAPARPAALAAALDGCEEALVIEQNQSGQLFSYLHGHFGLGVPARSLHRPGPLPLRPAELEAAIDEWMTR